MGERIEDIQGFEEEVRITEANQETEKERIEDIQVFEEEVRITDLNQETEKERIEDIQVFEEEVWILITTMIEMREKIEEDSYLQTKRGTTEIGLIEDIMKILNTIKIEKATTMTQTDISIDKY